MAGPSGGKGGSIVPWLIAAAVAFFVAYAGILPEPVEAIFRSVG